MSVSSPGVQPPAIFAHLLDRLPLWSTLSQYRHVLQRWPFGPVPGRAA